MCQKNLFSVFIPCFHAKQEASEGQDGKVQEEDGPVLLPRHLDLDPVRNEGEGIAGWDSAAVFGHQETTENRNLCIVLFSNFVANTRGALLLY